MVCSPSISIHALIRFDMLQILLVITSNGRFSREDVFYIYFIGVSVQMIIKDFLIKMAVHILCKRKHPDPAICINCSPNMKLQWMFYHGRDWFFITRPCKTCVAKQLYGCFVGKYNITPVIMSVVTCSFESNLFGFSGKKRNLFG